MLKTILNKSDHILHLPRETDVTEIIRSLSREGRVTAQTAVSGRRQLLDTFDWRVHGSGQMLELWGSVTEQRLRLSDYDSQRETIELSARKQPVFAADLPSAVLRRRLAAPLSVRALSSRCAIRGSLQILNVLDRRDKTIARIEIWRPQQRGALFVRVSPLRGYRLAGKHILKRLRKLDGAKRSDIDPLLAAAQALDCAPGTYPTWQCAELSADMRTDDALMTLLAHYSRIMDLNVSGMAQALDSEFLHQFRVGLRRVRALLRHSPGTLASARLTPFMRTLALLTAHTGPVRDADVHALVFPGYMTTLSERERTALGGLIDILESDCQRTHREFARFVASQRFRSGWLAWLRFVGERPPRASRQAMGPKPLADVAAGFIAAAARKVSKRARRIGESAPPQAYHDLRKSFKNLRYLIDAYGNYVSDGSPGRAVKNIKRLQDLLGEHQDLDVHQAALRDMQARMAQAGELAADTHQAMETLLASLAERAHLLRAQVPDELAAFRRLRLTHALNATQNKAAQHKARQHKARQGKARQGKGAR